METISTPLQKRQALEPLHVLLIGNNPIDMGKILDKLHQVRSQKMDTEIAFDLKSILERLVRFRPNFILIDDNIGKRELLETVNDCRRTIKRKTSPSPSSKIPTTTKRWLRAVSWIIC